MYRAQNALSISIHLNTVEYIFIKIWGAPKSHDIKTDKTFETT